MENILKNKLIRLHGIDDELNIDEKKLRLKYVRIKNPDQTNTNKYLLFYKYLNDNNYDDLINSYTIETTILSENYNVLRIDHILDSIKEQLNSQNISFEEYNEIYLKTDIYKKIIINDYNINIDDKKNDIIFTLLTSLKSNLNSYYNILLTISNSYNGKSSFNVNFNLAIKTDNDNYFENKFIKFGNNISCAHKNNLNIKILPIQNIYEKFKNIIYFYKNIKITDDNLDEFKNILNKKEKEIIDKYTGYLDDDNKNLYNLTLIFSQLKSSNNIFWVDKVNKFIEKFIKRDK